MMQKWEFLQLFGCIDNGRLLYEDLITCREAAYLNNVIQLTARGQWF